MTKQSLTFQHVILVLFLVFPKKRRRRRKSLLVGVGKNYSDPSVNDVIYISKLIFVNKNKGR